MDLGRVGARGFAVRQFHRLLVVVVGGTQALPASPPGAALLHSTGVECATAPHDRVQRPFLLGRWHELVVGSARWCALCAHCVYVAVPYRYILPARRNSRTCLGSSSPDGDRLSSPEPQPGV